MSAQKDYDYFDNDIRRIMPTKALKNALGLSDQEPAVMTGDMIDLVIGKESQTAGMPWHQLVPRRHLVATLRIIFAYSGKPFVIQGYPSFVPLATQRAWHWIWMLYEELSLWRWFISCTGLKDHVRVSNDMKFPYPDIMIALRDMTQEPYLPCRQVPKVLSVRG